MYIKVHQSKYRTIVSLCDKDLIGKKFEQKGLQLDITERFYKGEELAKETIIAVLREADILNIVGKKSIKLAIEIGVIDKANVIKIKGIPHAQFTEL